MENACFTVVYGLFICVVYNVMAGFTSDFWTRVHKNSFIRLMSEYGLFATETNPTSEYHTSCLALWCGRKTRFRSESPY